MPSETQSIDNIGGGTVADGGGGDAAWTLSSGNWVTSMGGIQPNQSNYLTCTFPAFSIPGGNTPTSAVLSVFEVAAFDAMGAHVGDDDILLDVTATDTAPDDWPTDPGFPSGASWVDYNFGDLVAADLTRDYFNTEPVVVKIKVVLNDPSGSTVGAAVSHDSAIFMSLEVTYVPGDGGGGVGSGGIGSSAGAFFLFIERTRRRIPPLWLPNRPAIWRPNGRLIHGT